MAVTQAQLKTDKQQLDMYGNTMERILMQNSYFQLAHVIFYTANSERDHKKRQITSSRTFYEKDLSKFDNS